MSTARRRSTSTEVGFNADHDAPVSDEVRFVQLTPPGSACSIAIGKGIVEGDSRSCFAGLQVVVEKAPTRRMTSSRARGVDVSDVQEFPWGRFVFFEDPDGNKWSVQELTPRP